MFNDQLSLQCVFFVHNSVIGAVLGINASFINHLHAVTNAKIHVARRLFGRYRNERKVVVNGDFLSMSTVLNVMMHRIALRLQQRHHI
jgi:hypothetical protein